MAASSTNLAVFNSTRLRNGIAEMFIEEIHLVSFKGFENFSLKCKPFTVLVGLNNSGKTSILQSIQLVCDLFIFALGGRSNRDIEHPDLNNPRWSSNPSSTINRLGFNAPDVLWLNKNTSVPCEISIKFSGDVRINVKVTGLSAYSIELFVGETDIREAIKEPQYQNVVEDIFALRATYTPPVAGLSPVENKLTYPQLIEKLDRGLISECWRSFLWWLWNDGNKDDFARVIEVVESYLPQLSVREPKLTHDSPERILIEFEQNGLTFDISTSGGGFRTVLGLAVILYFSKSKCLLLDEPDAHLHSSLQRQIARMLIDYTYENQIQIFVTSHAPDFIAEVPTENLIWIDRTKQEAKVSNSIGHFLVDLGSMTKADAVRYSGADKILFVEAGLDQNVIKQIVEQYIKETTERMNLFEDPTVIVCNLPNGKGDSKHLESFQRLIREAFNLNLKTASIVDNDYELFDMENNEKSSNTLLLKLERKEIENYLLDPKIISRAIQTIVQKRGKYTGNAARYPTQQEIQEKIIQILNSPEIRNIVYDRIVPQYREKLPKKLDFASKEEKGRQWFDEKWSNLNWQIKHCPGKSILASVRKWCQEEYSLSLSSIKLIEAIQEYPDDIENILEELQTFFYEAS